MTDEVLFKFLIPILIAAFGGVFTVLLGVSAYFLKKVLDKVDTLVVVVAKLEGKVELLDSRTEPIPKLQMDIQGFHDFKRRVEKTNQ